MLSEFISVPQGLKAAIFLGDLNVRAKALTYQPRPDPQMQKLERQGGLQRWSNYWFNGS
jgi:hypothetical protein